MTFRRAEAFVDLPAEVPCGQCIGCRLESSRQWMIRIVHESKMHEANSFVTLTYDDEHLPKDGSLQLEDWQKFAKRLRKTVGPFRFYHCGEYGETTGRPHYHAAVFGLDFEEDRELYNDVGGHKQFTSGRLERTWGKGFAVIGSLTYDSASYVASYVTKKITGGKAEAHYEGRRPEYSTMSRRPGIGKGYFDKWADQMYPRDEVIVKGHKMRPPKYYDSLAAESFGELVDQALKKKRREFEICYADQTPERRAVREKVRELTVEFFAREPGRRI